VNDNVRTGGRPSENQQAKSHCVDSVSYHAHVVST
jgi:hypothetical protein